jgi:hypothetical protein
MQKQTPDKSPRRDESGARAPSNPRRARKRQERQLLALVAGVLVIVGGALIALVYGPQSLLTALPCLLAGAAAIGLLYLGLTMAERWTKR